MGWTQYYSEGYIYIDRLVNMAVYAKGMAYMWNNFYPVEMTYLGGPDLCTPYGFMPFYI